MVSKTISITIPEQLVNLLQKEADEIGVSRSRFIGNILLDWQSKKDAPSNDCENQDRGFCDEFSITCTAPQKEAETCPEYKKNDGGVS
ncbi:MAG: hypothetical protein P9L97_05620 [Candidatus Tenebribacter davisii]|nr:hypothetical protein [Candidatus Tenebribacter davisii]